MSGEAALHWDDGTECDYTGYARVTACADTREEWPNTGPWQVYRFPEVQDDRGGLPRNVACCRIGARQIDLTPTLVLKSGVTPVIYVPVDSSISVSRFSLAEKPPTTAGFWPDPQTFKAKDGEVK